MKHNYLNHFLIKRFDGPITEDDLVYQGLDLDDLVVVSHVPNEKRKWWDRSEETRAGKVVDDGYVPDATYFARRDGKHTYEGRMYTPKELFSNSSRAERARAYFRQNNPEVLTNAFLQLSENDKSRAVGRGMISDDLASKYMASSVRKGIEKATPLAATLVGGAALGPIIEMMPEVFTSVKTFLASPIGQATLKALEVKFGADAAKDLITKSNPVEIVKSTLNGEYGDAVYKAVNAALDVIMMVPAMSSAGKIGDKIGENLAIVALRKAVTEPTYDANIYELTRKMRGRPQYPLSAELSSRGLHAGKVNGTALTSKQIDPSSYIDTYRLPQELYDYTDFQNGLMKLYKKKIETEDLKKFLWDPYYNSKAPALPDEVKNIKDLDKMRLNFYDAVNESVRGFTSRTDPYNIMVANGHNLAPLKSTAIHELSHLSDSKILDKMRDLYSVLGLNKQEIALAHKHLPVTTNIIVDGRASFDPQELRATMNLLRFQLMHKYRPSESVVPIKEGALLDESKFWVYDENGKVMGYIPDEEYIEMYGNTNDYGAHTKILLDELNDVSELTEDPAVANQLQDLRKKIIEKMKFRNNHLPVVAGAAIAATDETPSLKRGGKLNYINIFT